MIGQLANNAALWALTADLQTISIAKIPRTVLGLKEAMVLDRGAVSRPRSW